MTKQEILEAFEGCTNPYPFKDRCDWLLNFLKEHQVKYTFDSFQTLLISTDDNSPALKITLHKQGRRMKL